MKRKPHRNQDLSVSIYIVAYLYELITFNSITFPYLVCENDWESYSPTGGCYKHFSDLKTWEDARRFCQENVPYNVGDLASVSDAGTNDFLKTLIQDSYAWIGGFLNESSSTWMWSDGTTWQYNNWFDGQPNNGGGMQTHVAMNFESSGEWNDEYKNDENSYVCHYKGIK